ncbi:MAG: 3-keto-5-aminohexanoate cleavage protein [Candidatus Lokiarchaeota archaeon]|nr:3-keto-5-aminohexanoate cleavage protein [Candidatus Lokiarchaeota archaeon]
MEKLIISAAICGAEVTKEHNPNVPYTVKEIGIEAEKAFLTGASIIHLHVREDDGTPTQDIKRFQACVNEIKRRCPDVIIQPSTGGALGMSNEERLQPIYMKPQPEMATLDCGTMNFGEDEIFINTENTIIKFASEMNKLGIKPELECFDKGMIDMALRLNKKEIIKEPMHFNFVLGVNGGITATPRDLIYMVNSIPKSSTFTVCAIGKYEFPMVTLSIILGGHARVGFEDNIYLSKGILAKSNKDLVEKIVKISQELGRDIASPSEARKILNLD